MKFLEANYKVFTLLSIVPSNGSTNRWIQLRNFTILLLAFGIPVSASVASLVYIVNNFRTDLRSSLFSLLLLSGHVSAAYTSIVGYFWLRLEIRETFRVFQEFYDQNKRKDTLRFMEAANKKSERAVNYFNNAFLVGCPFYVLFIGIVSICHSIFKYGYINVDALYKVYHYVLPWNPNTILGWVFELIYSISSTIVYLFLTLAFLTLFISIGEYYRAFYGIFQTQVNQIDCIAGIEHVRRIEIKKLLRELITYHISAKELFQQSTRIYSPIVLIQLISSTMACTIFETDSGIQNFDILATLMVFAAGIALSKSFLYCYFGKCATDFYAEFANCLYESNWMTLHYDIQKYFILMIGNGQKLLYYSGFDMVNLNLELFCRMLATVFRSYLMFRTLAAEY